MDTLACNSCGASASNQDQHCRACGTRLAKGSQSISFGDNASIPGGVQQAGRDIINMGPPSPPSVAVPSMDPEPIWRSPITLGLLTWVGTGLALLSLFPFYRLLEPAVGLFQGALLPHSNGQSLWWFILGVVLILLATLSLFARGIVRWERRVPLMGGLALSGRGGRLTLERVRTGTCPLCGKATRFYNKPTAWIDVLREDGSLRRRVTDRAMAIECRANSDHFWWVDSTAGP